MARTKRCDERPALNEEAVIVDTESSEHGGGQDQERAEGSAKSVAVDSMRIRDRIRELRRVAAHDLLANPKNWRRHPKAHAEALRGLLAEVGYADALLARELPDGRLMLIDGHLRKDTTPDAIVPVLVLDLDEAEADKLLLTLDPLASLAEADAERIGALPAQIDQTGDLQRKWEPQPANSGELAGIVSYAATQALPKTSFG